MVDALEDFRSPGEMEDDVTLVISKESGSRGPGFDFTPEGWILP